METNKVDQNKKVRNTIGFLLTVIMIGLTGFVLYIQNENYQTLGASADLSLSAHVNQADNYRHYVKQYVATKGQLIETQARLGKMTLELELVSKELESTKSVLNDTQNLLAQAQEENKVLKGDPAATANLQKLYAAKTNQDISKNLESLKKQNESYSGELSQLKSDLSGYKSDVANMDEGGSLIKELKGKIRAVKEKMNSLKKEAALAKEAARDERNRQLALLGNNGYIVKDGKVNVPDQPAEKTVDIDVTFVP